MSLLRASIALVALVPLVLADGQPACNGADDEVSLLQHWSELSSTREIPEVLPVPRRDELGEQGLPLSASSLIPPEGFSIVASTDGTEANPQDFERLSQSSPSFIESSSLGEMSQEARLKNEIQELRQQSADHASELSNAIKQQQISNNAVEHAKLQLQRQAQNARQAYQSELEAKQSEQKAWQAARDENIKEKMLEDKVKQANDDLKKMTQERAAFAEKLSLIEKEAEQVNIREHKKFEASLAAAQQSEQKAWKVAKAEAEKALAERKLKENLLAGAKAELTRLKGDVSKVQAQASEALQKEVQQVDRKVEEVKKESSMELKKASGRMKQEHAQVQQVVAWANKVQQEATAKMQLAKKAQEQSASAVSWADVAKREAARAAAAQEELEKLQALQAKNAESGSFSQSGKDHSAGYGFD